MEKGHHQEKFLHKCEWQPMLRSKIMIVFHLLYDVYIIFNDIIITSRKKLISISFFKNES